jgi:4-alpha-glucanotransferase
LARDILFHQYLQWLADLQWQAARTAASACGVSLFGDLPFMVDGDSADVWARQAHFNLDVTVGAPPDAFSADGQDWGMPACRWDVMAADGFGWLRDRARRSADLYDGYRIDHLVGFYRTYARPRHGGAPFFTPSTEHEQVSLGEQVLRVFGESGVAIVAEDLGTVPDYVRASLARLDVPGFRVLRWERHWHVKGQPYRDPSEYPAVSVATSGTHDTEPLVTWWERASDDERQAVSDLPTIRQLTGGDGLVGRPYIPTVRDALLEALFVSGSCLVMNVMQDVFGWADRINEPSTVNEINWTFRLPWPSDRLGDVPEAGERQAKLREWSEKYSR